MPKSVGIITQDVNTVPVVFATAEVSGLGIIIEIYYMHYLLVDLAKKVL
jgi:hypothetical protein